MYSTCECRDTGCHAHPGAGSCGNRAIVVLFEVGKPDRTGKAFCQDCALEALDSGDYSAESVRDIERE